jgi:RluA family pseudouridine synthase
VHRLDRDTSGVLVVGKSAEMGRRLAVQFERRRVRKRYLAVMEGVPPEEEFTVDLPLARRKGSVLAMAVDMKKGKQSVTRFRVLGAGQRFSLVSAEPRTGRQHQIRVHAAAVGFPLAADHLYGRRRVLVAGDVPEAAGRAGEEVLLGRCPLHAAALEYDHPRTGRRRRAEAAPAGDMAGLAELMGLRF